jgi:hypothetical protein
MTAHRRFSSYELLGFCVAGSLGVLRYSAERPATEEPQQLSDLAF